MKIKNKLILSSLAVIAVAGGIAGGSTYALFTSNDNVNIAITSGVVKVDAGLTTPTLYSALAKKYYDDMTSKPTVELDESSNIIANEAEDHNIYYNKVVSDGFTTGGTATFATDGTLTLDKIAPGDKIKTSLTLTNTSNISIKYRVVAECVDLSASSLSLYSGLDFTFGTKDMSGIKKYASKWTSVAANGSITPIDIAIQLPVTATDELQNKTTHIKFSIEAVQENAYVDDKEEITEIFGYDSEKVTKTGDTLNDVTLSDGDVSVKVVSSKAKAGDTNLAVGDELNLVVTSSEENKSITVDEGQAPLNYEIKVTNQNGEPIKDQGSYDALLVSIDIGENRNVEGVYHYSDAITNYTYNSTTGILSFTITSFSPFTVVVDAEAKIGFNVYNTYSEALTAAESTEDEETITVLSDIDLTSVYDADSDNAFLLMNKTIDLNGHEIKSNNFSIVYQGDNLTIKNGSLDSNGGSYALFIGDGDCYDDDVLFNATLENVTCTGGVNVYAHKLTVKNCDVKGTQYYAIWADDYGQITLNSCNYSTIGTKETTVLDSGEDENSFIIVNGGNYITSEGQTLVPESANVTLKGGTYNQEPPTSKIATGYEKIQNVDTTWTIRIQEVD